MFKFIVIMLFSSFLVTAYGTSFHPVSYEKLLRSTDGVFMGHFLGKKYLKLDDGSIATQMRFKVSEAVDLPVDAMASQEIKVFYPGGQVDSTAQFVDGVPEFSTGEQVVVMIKEGEDGRYWGMSLGMGTYRVVKMGQQFFMINSIFPNNPALSQISLDTFRAKVQDIRKTTMKETFSDKYSLQSKEEYARTQFKAQQSRDNGNYRTIASQGNTAENSHEPNVMSSFWLLLILGVLGISAGLVASKRSR